MPNVEQSVEVNVAVGTAYDQWTRFESFPRWMEGVASVERIDDGRLHWVAKVRSEFATVEGETHEWDARITEQVRDKRLSWETIRGKPGREAQLPARPRSSRSATSSSRVTFRIDLGAGRRARDAERSARCGEPGAAADLARFKDFIEASPRRRTTRGAGAPAAPRPPRVTRLYASAIGLTCSSRS